MDFVTEGPHNLAPSFICRYRSSFAAPRIQHVVLYDSWVGVKNHVLGGLSTHTEGDEGLIYSCSDGGQVE